MLLRRIFGICLMMAALIIPAGVARAQSGGWIQLARKYAGQIPALAENTTSADEQAASPASQELAQGGILDVIERQKKALAGSWVVTINAPGLEPFKALFNFNEGGTLVGSTQTDFDINEQVACTAGYGVWAHQGGRTFTYTYLVLCPNLKSQLQFQLKLRPTVTLNEAGDQWSGSYKFEFLTPQGQVFFSGTDQIQATRIKVEPVN